MSKIKIIDERKYPLPNVNKDQLSYYRWEHRATLSINNRKFIVFLDNGIKIEPISVPGKAYIEEITDGSMKVIQEDELFKLLHEFSTKKGFLDFQMPIKKGKIK